MNREPAIKVVAMPKDANADGDIFGGWLLSMMDLAGGTMARHIAKNRVVTVAITDIIFHLPVFIGDCLECYGDLIKIGNSSIHIKIESWAERKIGGHKEKVTEGSFIFVAIDEDRKPVKVQK